jgi:hypothetical protein
MSDVPIPYVQLLMMFLFVRKNRTCRDGWTNAGFTRRAATLVWAGGFLQQNGTLGVKDAPDAITVTDIFPSGMDALQNTDVARLHNQLAVWLDYWSVGHPTDTLQKAMLNLILRLVRMKRGWIKEYGDAPFAFDMAMKGVTSAEVEKYLEGEKV